MNINSKDANQVWDYKGWFWDDVNQRTLPLART
jgi:hypothetical protein